MKASNPFKIQGKKVLTLKNRSYNCCKVNLNRENKWCIKNQAGIIFIIGIILVPVCLGCADTRTTCKAKKNRG
jgi:hypothetical protein